MTKYHEASFKNTLKRDPQKFRCPHCNVSQKVATFWVDYGPLETTIYQCLECSDFTIDARLFPIDGDVFDRRLLPVGGSRYPETFKYCDPEVENSYREACALTGVSAAAAGAFARRTVELVLEKRGYDQTWLAQKIDAAIAEESADLRLPKRLLSRLNYLKETGNFGVHIRRNTATAEIVAVDAVEVDACLDTVEELIQECFEQPGEDEARRLAMNEKLIAAGKKPI